MIYNFMTSGNILILMFVFQKVFPLILFFDLHNKLIKYTLVNKDETSYLFSLHHPSKILAYPAGSPVNLMAYCDQITISYTNHCFNFFSLFSNYLCLVSFCCILLTLLAVLPIFYFIRLLSLSLPNAQPGH